eukprot:3315476-Pyramimonas_sp.AAC.1
MEASDPRARNAESISKRSSELRPFQPTATTSEQNDSNVQSGLMIENSHDGEGSGELVTPKHASKSTLSAGANRHQPAEPSVHSLPSTPRVNTGVGTAPDEKTLTYLLGKAYVGPPASTPCKTNDGGVSSPVTDVVNSDALDIAEPSPL